MWGPRSGLRGSGPLQRDFRDLRWAVETERKTDGSDAAIDVELHVRKAEQAGDVLFAHRGKDQRTDQGQAHLAAVGVAGEHEVDQRKAGVLAHLVGVVGFVGHQDDRRSGVSRDGGGQVGDAGSGVVDAGQPEAVASAFDRGELVDQRGDSDRGEGADDEAAINGDIVVSEDGVTLRALEAA